jgi:hypothetical protein
MKALDKLVVPVAVRFVVEALATWRLVPVAELNTRESTKRFRKLANTANKLVVVALVREALVAKRLEEVEFPETKVVRVAFPARISAVFRTALVAFKLVAVAFPTTVVVRVAFPELIEELA